LAALKVTGLQFRHDVFLDRKMVSGDLPEYLGPDLSDAVCRALRNLLLQQHSVDFGPVHVRDAAECICESNRFDPICDYLDSVQWDGVPRIDQWLSGYLGAEDTPLHREFGPKFLCAMVRRAKQPGCKFDHILILEGRQGAGKSQVCSILAGAPEFFSDARILHLDGRAQQEALKGRWVFEFGELAGMNKADVETLKNFITSTEDRGRAAYARFSTNQQHHCYRERVKDPVGDTEADLKGEEKDEAKENNEAARMWISGLEAVKRKLGISLVYDLSATPFFLRGSGYVEGTLFPWTMSDFSLMDAIECGIVKLPRVPVADNVPGGDVPKFRNLWEYIGKKLPKKGRNASGKSLDPLSLPAELLTALEALYGHYRKTFDLWEHEGIGVPPVFIIVCNNTSTSELIYKYVSGFDRQNEDGSATLENGRLELFRNYDDYGNRLARPNTILIDSAQLESGEALDKNFHEMAEDEIERFRRDMVERTGDIRAGETIDDATLLREVMNTVGKKGKLGEQIRCVVSVSMLTEGWDTNTVTHILGVRAFGTQLLCEQVVGRALRRESYQLNDEGLFNVEYADVLGIPFDFAAKPVVAPPAKPCETVRVHAIRPERDALEIVFPRVEGYRVELPEERLEARFGPDSVLDLTPELVGPSVTKNQGIIGEGVDLTVAHLEDMRNSTILFHLARHLLYSKYRDPGDKPKLHLFGQLKRITRQWLEGGYLRCSGGTFPAQLLYKEIEDMAAERIKAAITETLAGERPVKVILDAYNPTGSTSYVNFTTSKETRWQTDPRKCHVNWVVCDSDWEAEFCRVAESHPKVHAYVKNQNLGLEVPYLMGSTPRKYFPDFIVQVNDGKPDPLNLIVEIKGYRGEDAKEKANAMRAYWVPGVNNLGKFGRWAFAEFTAVYEIEREFGRVIERFLKAEAAV
jgi:type III restriction enzyme